MPSSSISKISSISLTTTSTSITFSSIPATFEDLIVRISGRAEDANNLTIEFNGSTSNYTLATVGIASANISSVVSYNRASFGYNQIGYFATPSYYGAASSMFSTVNIYIGGYKTSRYKLLISEGLNDANTSNVNTMNTLGEWAQTAAITSLTFRIFGGNISSGTNAVLYGVNKS